MTVMLNMPRAIIVPFSGAGIIAHQVLKQFSGQVLKLHGGLNIVQDELALHPLLRKFVVDERIAVPVVPMVPLAGAGPAAVPVAPVVHEPIAEPLNPTAAMLSHANEPDADKKALERAVADAKAEYERLAALAAERENAGEAPASTDPSQAAADAETRLRASQAGAAPGARPATAPVPDKPAADKK